MEHQQNEMILLLQFLNLLKLKVLVRLKNILYMELFKFDLLYIFYITGSHA